VQKAGAVCIAYRPNRPSIANWLARQEDLARWLKSLPKPVGILAWNSNDGRHVIDACRFVGLSVPEQVAVLSGDDDELLCEACSSPLSGIAVPAQQIGYEAAAMLDRLICGRRPSKTSISIGPTGIVARQSTDVLAIEDQDLVQAIRFIREHACEAIRVEDVLRVVPLSRRQLEIRFREVLGCSPADEIRRVRLKQAKRLLSQTDMTIPDVAIASGFGSPEYLAYAVKHDTGLSPLKFRSQVRAR
jgi:LacI family transcriptional regulator